MIDIADFWSIRVESSGASPIRMTGERDTDAQDRELVEIYGIGEGQPTTEETNDGE